MKKFLFATAALLTLSGTAKATTWDLSTLNVNAVTNPAPHFNVCPCTDPTSGTTIFNNQSNNQANGWTIGTDTLYYMGDGRGNNAAKIYLPSGAPSFPVPPGQTVGSHNTQGTGDYAQSNGFPLYFWFGNPGNTTTTPAVGVPVFLDSFYLSGGTGSVLTVTGYSDLGVTPIDTTTVTGTGLQQVTLDWAGIEQISISGGRTFYVNDIEINDAVVAPAPLIGHGLLVVLAIGGVLSGSRLLERSKRRWSLGIVTPHAAV
jgi:hypothetical protein